MGDARDRADFAVKRLDEMETTFNGLVRRVRIALGVKSFAIIVVELPADSADVFPEHDHRDDGSEEVYWLLTGSAQMVIDGAEYALEPGVVVRVGPGPRRRLRSGPDGARVLMLSGVPGQAYVPDDEAERAKSPEDFDDGASSLQTRPTT